MKTTITTGSTHGLQPGDTLVASVTETRWWVRLWYYIQFRETPLRKLKYKVTGATTTTLTVK